MADSRYFRRVKSSGVKVVQTQVHTGIGKFCGGTFSAGSAVCTFAVYDAVSAAGTLVFSAAVPANTTYIMEPPGSIDAAVDILTGICLSIPAANESSSGVGAILWYAERV